MGRIATVGNFDGVHRGHRLLLEFLARQGKEKGLEPLVFVFTGSPLKIIAPARVPPELMPWPRRREIMRSLGLEALPIDFTPQMLRRTSLQFMKELQQEYDVDALVLGYDNRVGCEPGMDYEAYRCIGRSIGLEVLRAPELPRVSSTLLRSLLEQGRVEDYAGAAGSPFRLEGKVVHGRGIGHTLGFATANLQPQERMAVPARGVYATRAIFGGKTLDSVTNVGMRPTIEGDSTPRLSVETHIPGWAGNIYGHDMPLEFISRLRDEHRFDSLGSLQNQLARDVDAALLALNEVV